jgi:hypothetical protein
MPEISAFEDFKLARQVARAMYIGSSFGRFLLEFLSFFLHSSTVFLTIQVSTHSLTVSSSIDIKSTLIHQQLDFQKTQIPTHLNTGQHKSIQFNTSQHLHCSAKTTIITLHYIFQTTLTQTATRCANTQKLSTPSVVI